MTAVRDMIWKENLTTMPLVRCSKTKKTASGLRIGKLGATLLIGFPLKADYHLAMPLELMVCLALVATKESSAWKILRER